MVDKTTVHLTNDDVSDLLKYVTIFIGFETEIEKQI